MASRLTVVRQILTYYQVSLSDVNPLNFLTKHPFVALPHLPISVKEVPFS